MAKFNIKDVFFLKSINVLFIIGDIKDGRIKGGMKFNLVGREFIIDRIEFVDGKKDGVPIADIALGITPNDKSFFDAVLSEYNHIEIEIHED